LNGRAGFWGCTAAPMCHNLLANEQGSLPMSLGSHLTELVRRHQQIDDAIAMEEARPSVDDLKLHEMKRKKLVLKDEIEKLKHETEPVTTH
jgi:hypothetical protein